MRLCYSLVMFMALVMLSSALSLITGCGQKGPLYHPDEVQQQNDKQKSKKTSAKQPAQP